MKSAITGFSCLNLIYQFSSIFIAVYCHIIAERNRACILSQSLFGSDCSFLLYSGQPWRYLNVWYWAIYPIRWLMRLSILAPAPADTLTNVEEWAASSSATIALIMLLMFLLACGNSLPEQLKKRFCYLPEILHVLSKYMYI